MELDTPATGAAAQGRTGGDGGSSAAAEDGAAPSFSSEFASLGPLGLIVPKKQGSSSSSGGAQHRLPPPPPPASVPDGKETSLRAQLQAAVDSDDYEAVQALAGALLLARRKVHTILLSPASCLSSARPHHPAGLPSCLPAYRRMPQCRARQRDKPT
jgi:hypothetical protein